jgi:hypothetical protein
VQCAQSSPATRVVPAELLWQAAQQPDTSELVAQWLLEK